MVIETRSRRLGVQTYPDFVIAQETVVPPMSTAQVRVQTDALGERVLTPGVFSTFNSRSRTALVGGEVPDVAKLTLKRVLGKQDAIPTVRIDVHNHGAGDLVLEQGKGLGYRVDYDKNALLTGEALTKRVDSGDIVPSDHWRWLTRDGSHDRSDRIGIIVEFDPTQGRSRYVQGEIPEGPTAGFRDRVNELLIPVTEEDTGFVVYSTQGAFSLNRTVGYIPRSYMLSPDEGLANAVHVNSRHLSPGNSYDWPILFELRTPHEPEHIPVDEPEKNEVGIVFFDAEEK